MLESSMDRFFSRFDAVSTVARGLARLGVGLWVMNLVGPVHALERVPQGLVVQLRAGVVASGGEEPLPVVLKETPQAWRERALAHWQRRHGQHAAHMRALAQAGGLAVVGVGSAGSALRLDLDVPDGAALDAAMRRLRLHPDVQSVTPNVRVRHAQATAAPSDPLFIQQWHLQSPAVSVAAINLPGAWARDAGSASVTVAVVDSGVRFEHPDLAGKLWPGYDFVSEVEFANDGNGRDADASDPGDWVTVAESRTALFRGCDVIDSSWHGTAIAGQIAATLSNAVGGVGVHSGARVLPVRVAGKCGAVLSDLLDGVRWASGLPVTGVPTNPNPARVINLSYGGDGACGDAYQSTVDDITAAGALLVVAAGNAGVPLTRPADCQGVLAVTAVRGDGAKASYASYGPQVGLAAPGGSGQAGAEDAGLLTTRNSGTREPGLSSYGTLTGTSFSAPLAAGVAGWVLSLRPQLEPAALSTVLRGAVRPHVSHAALPQCQAAVVSQGVCNCTPQTCGSGLLDAGLAVSAALALPASDGATPPAVSPSAPVSDSSSGGGGAVHGLWGLALWGWVGLLGWSASRRAAPGGHGRSGPTA